MVIVLQLKSHHYFFMFYLYYAIVLSESYIIEKKILRTFNKALQIILIGILLSFYLDVFIKTPYIMLKKYLFVTHLLELNLGEDTLLIY